MANAVAWRNANQFPHLISPFWLQMRYPFQKVGAIRRPSYAGQVITLSKLRHFNPFSSTARSLPEYPDFMLDPDAVTKDTEATWRSGLPPNYSNTRRVWQQTKSQSHNPLSLPYLVENLVKNWEIEASFKTNISEWRTVSPVYTFSVNGGPPQDAAHMVKVGTYNAIIAAPSPYYSAEFSDFEQSHKTFKNMMPVFAWEVMEVYSGPPRVAFKWRHWGEMRGDYVGRDGDGKEVRRRAHGGLLEIQGVSIAKLDDRCRIEALETWFDPLEMFRQLTPKAGGGSGPGSFVSAVSTTVAQELTGKAPRPSEHTHGASGGDHVNPNAGSGTAQHQRNVGGRCPFKTS